MKLYRHRHNWTQQDVADRLLISRKTISSWENSRSYPDIFMLVQISDLYHISLDDLLREDHEMIDNYKEEHLVSNRINKGFVISYWLNIVMATTSLFTFSFAQYISNPLLKGGLATLPFILLANLIILVSYADWHEIKRKYGFWTTWVILSVLKLQLSFMKVTVEHGGDFAVGYTTGVVIACILTGLSLTCVIWLFPQVKERIGS